MTTMRWSRRQAPNPNAARLFPSFLHADETQPMFTDFIGQHSVHAQVKPKPAARRSRTSS